MFSSSESGHYALVISLLHYILISKEFFIDIASWIKELALKLKQTLYFVDNLFFKNSTVTS